MTDGQAPPAAGQRKTTKPSTSTSAAVSRPTTTSPVVSTWAAKTTSWAAVGARGVGVGVAGAEHGGRRAGRWRDGEEPADRGDFGADGYAAVAAARAEQATEDVVGNESWPAAATPVPPSRQWTITPRPAARSSRSTACRPIALTRAHQAAYHLMLGVGLPPVATTGSGRRVDPDTFAPPRWLQVGDGEVLMAASAKTSERRVKVIDGIGACG